MQADRWLAEGADSLTVQPVLTCADIVTRLREHTRAPLKVIYITFTRFGSAILPE